METPNGSTANNISLPTENSQVANELNAQPTNTSQDEIQDEIQDDDAVMVGGKRKLRSPAWSHFERKTIDGEVKAECKYCSRKLAGNSKNGTKHLLQHFERCPKRPYRDIRQHILVKEEKKADGSSTFLSNYAFVEATSRRNLAEMIIVHEYPLSMVEHHGFRKFVGSLQPLFKVPTRNTIKSDILKIYDYEKEKTLKLLKKNKSRIAITTDMWTANHQKKGFMAITTHFIDQNWNLQSRILSRLKTREPRYNSLPTEKDWELAKDICDRLQLFYEVTVMFSGSKYPTANVFFPSVCEIAYSLRNWADSSVDIIKKMACKMIFKFDKYWSVIHGVVAMAAVLDPRYKLKFVELLLPVLHGEEKVKIEAHNLTEFVKSIYKEYEASAPSEKNEYKSVGSSSLDKGFTPGHRAGFKKLFSEIATKASEHDDSESMTELDNYLKEPRLPEDTELDLLMWWKTNGFKYPTLQRIAKDLLAVPVSTVASESAFSTSGRLISPHRSRLHPNTLKALMCAQSWLLNEIRATCSDETEAYCRTIEYDYDVEEGKANESGASMDSSF